MAVLTDRKLQRRRLARVLTGAALILLLAFLWWHWRQFNGRAVPLGTLDGTYSATDQSVVLRIESGRVELTRGEKTQSFTITHYADNVLELSGYVFVVIDPTTIYAGEDNRYLYRFQEAKAP